MSATKKQSAAPVKTASTKKIEKEGRKVQMGAVKIATPLSKAAAAAKPTTDAPKAPKAPKAEKTFDPMTATKPNSMCVQLLAKGGMSDNEIQEAVVKAFPGWRTACLSCKRAELNAGGHVSLREFFKTELPLVRMVRDATGKLVPYVKDETKAKAKKSDAVDVLTAAGVLPAKKAVKK